MAHLFEELKAVITDLQRDVDRFYEKGNKSAGTRVRKGMQDIKKLSQAIRIDVQDRKSRLK